MIGALFDIVKAASNGAHRAYPAPGLYPAFTEHGIGLALPNG
jgi:hypothetical protein